jgi:chromosome segregation ATPase
MSDQNDNSNDNNNNNDNQNDSLNNIQNDETEEDNNEYYEHLPADHPHLRRFQLALADQLKSEEEKIRLLYKEKNEDSKKLKREREEIGIALYSLQQQFANVESNFNEEYSKCKALEEQQKQETDRLTEEIKMYNDKYQSVREQEKMVLQSGEDLNQLNSMLKYVETYNLQVQSEIEVTKTTANKVEENIINQERKKKEQDFFIDMLETRVKNLAEKKLLYEAQYKSQQEETKEAKINLAEADEEIERIREKKRDLIKDLDKALFNLRLKDNAKSTVLKNIEEQEEEKLKLESQISRYRILIRNENLKNNELEDNLRQCKRKLQIVENQIKELQIKHGKLEEKRHFIETSINKTKIELDNLEKIQQNLDFELELINKNKVKLLNEARALQDKNLIVLSDKETHEKQGDNLFKANQKINKEKFDVEVEKDSKANEIIRVQIDKINVESQNIKLKNKLELMNEEITKLEDDYNKKSLRIKANHKALEKKQLEMDKLNKIYGELMKNKKGEDQGEFEVAIDKLQTKVRKLRKEIRFKENEWLNKKQELVKKETILNNVSEECVEKRSKRMILDRKKLRLNSNYAIHEKEIKEIEFSLKQLREYEMVKFGKLLGKNMNSNQNLEHQIFDVEIQFKEKLTAMENETVKLEMEIEVLREEKADTLAQIIETERQIHLWERKIELQEQMQKIIKPESGLKEIDEMKSYIHRQKLLYKKLQAEQDDIIKNMERSVQRRDFIKVRYPVDEFGTGNVKQKVNKTKEINDLMEQINHINRKKKEYSNKITNTKNQVNELNNEINQLENESFNIQTNAFDVRNKYFKEKINTNNLFCKTKQFQDGSKLIEDFQNKKFKPKNKNVLNEEISKIQNENEQLLETLRNFKDTHNEMGVIIEEVMKIN